MSQWIFLRGLTRESRHWGDFPAAFRAAIPDAAVLTLDLPGAGARCREDSPTTIGGIVEACRADLAGRGLSPPYHLLALSLGAMVALDWAQRHPQEVRAGVLINTSLRGYSHFYQRLRPANYPALIGLLLGADDAPAREATIMRLTSRAAPPPGALIDDWIAWRRQFPVSRRNSVRQLLAALRYRAPSRAIATPLLFLCSRGDALVDPLCTQQIAKQWHCDCAVHPHAGHDLPLDDAAWVVAEVRRWLLRKERVG